MPDKHKNKTFATFLAAFFGGLGLHRFYLRGARDFAGWMHFATLPMSALWMLARPEQQTLFLAAPFILSVLVAFVEALVIGLESDEKWDEKYNPGSMRQSRSGWPLAVILVLTFGAGAVALIAFIARSFDLLFTGGAYG